MKTVDELGISPIPWELLDDEPTVVTKLDEDVYGVVAECRDDANARLIAATPELYEALRKLMAVAINRMPFQPTLDEIEIIANAQDAIAKAGGGEIK